MRILVLWASKSRTYTLFQVNNGIFYRFYADRHTDRQRERDRQTPLNTLLALHSTRPKHILRTTLSSWQGLSYQKNTQKINCKNWKCLQFVLDLQTFWGNEPHTLPRVIVFLWIRYQFSGSYSSPRYADTSIDVWRASRVKHPLWGLSIYRCGNITKHKWGLGFHDDADLLMIIIFIHHTMVEKTE